MATRTAPPPTCCQCRCGEALTTPPAMAPTGALFFPSVPSFPCVPVGFVLLPGTEAVALPLPSASLVLPPTPLLWIETGVGA